MNTDTPTELFNKDCIAGILSEDKKYDLVITSPPYNAGKEYENKLSLQEYKRFVQQWLSVVSDKISETGSLWLNVGYIHTGKNCTLPLTYLYYEASTLPLIQEIVWQYEGEWPIKSVSLTELSGGCGSPKTRPRSNSILIILGT